MANVFYGKTDSEAAKDLLWRFSRTPSGTIQAVNYDGLIAAAAWAVVCINHWDRFERKEFLDVLGLEQKNGLGSSQSIVKKA